jgi:hypothetical protein
MNQREILAFLDSRRYLGSIAEAENEEGRPSTENSEAGLAGAGI